MREISSPLDGFLSPLGQRRGVFSPASLFASGEEGTWLDTSDISTLFQDTAGTTPVTASGQTIARVNDKSGNGLNATQATTAARPSYIVDADGAFIQHDPVDDALTVTLPDLGTEATVAYVTRSEVRLLEDQTISGSYTLPAQELANFVVIDRALTFAEKVSLIRFLASKVEGVNYGAEIDRLTLIAVNAVDVFVYDTSKDSDGGAWATDYPAQMVIVAEATAVKIYDATDPGLPLHTTLDFTGYTVTALTAVSGVLAVATTTGLATFNLADGDETVGLDYTTSTTPAIVNNACNDCAATVLPDAPIDPATGLPVPTVAVATNGGVSVIKYDGTVVDSSNTGNFRKIAFDNDHSIWATEFNGVDDINVFPNYDVDGFSIAPANRQYYSGSTPSTLADPLTALLGGASGYSGGLTRIDENPTTPLEGMVAYTTSTYNTGWMPGDIKGAFLSDTDDTDLVGGTDADRSVNANPLTVNGTITRTPVASGADLVAYSGFSASNYLEQPYNPDLDFGTGDFCVMGWVKNQQLYDTFLARSDGVTTGTEFVLQTDDTAANMRFYFGGTQRAVTGIFPTSGWWHLAFLRSSGVLYVYVNGVQKYSVADATNVSQSGATLQVGIAINVAVSIGIDFFEGSLALLRISATAPTAEQIAKIYNDEKVLFQENAQATLYGASDAVTALAHDPDTGLLHAGTSAGRSVFDGLRRVGNTTTSVSTAISASGGLVVEK